MLGTTAINQVTNLSLCKALAGGEIGLVVGADISVQTDIATIQGRALPMLSELDQLH